MSACAARGPRIPGPLGVVRDDSTGPVAVPEPAAPDAPAPPRHPPRGDRHALAERLADAAEALVGGRVPRGFRDDCSGFVASAADRVGLVLGGGTADLHAKAKALGALHHRKEPARGDLVFFDRTYDRDGNGRLDDALTHVGVVVEVEADGTVRVAHRSDALGLSILRMNLHHPDEATGPDGAVWNDPLRRARGASDRVPTLAGALWSGFATIRDADREAWAP